MQLDKICKNCFKNKNDYDVCPYCGWSAGSKPVQANQLAPGTVLEGRYVIGTVLGFGGFGTTYKAWDITLNEIIAVKEFYPSGLVNRVPGDTKVVIYSGDRAEQYAALLKRFHEEAVTMAKFGNNLNIVKVQNYFETNNTAYIAMEFLDGQSLSAYLKEKEEKGEKLDSDMIIHIVDGLTKALSAIHMQKIIHRDIHPSNVFITKNGDVKLIDLGAARLSSEENEKTMTNVITPGYAPPEQYRNKSRQGPYTDIYGLGAVFYKMVTGKTPDESVDRMIDDQLKSPAEVNPEIPENIDKAIMKAMALKHEFRFQTIEQFRKVVFENKQIDNLQTEIKKRKARKNVVITLFTLFTLCSVAGILIFNSYVKANDLGILDDASISMWIPVDDALSDDVGSLYSQLAADFNNTVEDAQILIDITMINKDVYAEELEKAYKAGDMPDIFASEYCDNIGAKAQKLNKLTDIINTYDYKFLYLYGEYYASSYAIPTGFNVAVMYVNENERKTMEISDINSVNGKNEFFDAVVSSQGRFSVEKDNFDDIAVLYSSNIYSSYIYKDLTLYDDIKKNLTDLKREYEKSAKDAALSPQELIYGDNLVYLIGDTSIYSDVQSGLPGYYKMIPLKNNDAMYGTFENVWSVSKQSVLNDRKAAMRFIDFLLTEYSQDILYIQNYGALPLNTVCFYNYIDINSELEFLRNESSIVFAGENQSYFNKMSNITADKIYNNISESELESYLSEIRKIGDLQ